MKSTLTLTFFLLTIIGIYSCERPIAIELPEQERKLVVFAPFSDQAPIEVQLSRSQGFSIDSFFTTLAEFNAVVNLYENDIFLERLENVLGDNPSVPVYRSSTIPKPGSNYKLEISSTQNPDIASVSASNSIPSSAPQNVLAIKNHQNYAYHVDSLKYEVEAVLIFNDPSEQEDFYHLKIFQNIESFVRNGQGDTVKLIRVVELSPRVSENDNNMVSSFDGGMLFNDKVFNGKAYSITFDYKESLNRNQRFGKLHTELRRTSKDYYLYYTSLSRQISSPAPPFSEPVILYSNVENGLGLFGGYTVSIDSVSIEN